MRKRAFFSLPRTFIMRSKDKRRENEDMTLTQWIKSRVLKWLGLQHLSQNPNSERYQFINDEETVRRQRLDECRIWYVGDSDELQNFYTGRKMGGDAQEPIYNRNKPNYFWGISVKPNEKPVKKVHSGLPKAIIDTLSNVIGAPSITSEDKKENEALKGILQANDFDRKLTQEARPLTLAEGWGGWKVNFDKSVSDRPVFQFYEGKDVEFVVKSGVLVGMIFKDYYKSEDKDYVLLETRRVANGDSIVEYELYRVDKGEEATRVDLKTIPGLESLPEDGYVLRGYKKVLGVPCKYFYDVFNKDYGKSVFAGKIDLFDDLDQTLSQASQTDRVSTPVEYYPVDLLERDANGNTKVPNVYNRQFIAIPSYPDGDGKSSSKIDTSQPVLNFAQYSERAQFLVNEILIGILSPASMGIDVSRKDNADAQREKEKVTMFTRSSIIAAETRELKDLASIALALQEYMDTGSVTIKEHDVSVKYDEYASPTFDNLSKTLVPVWQAGAMSDEMLADRLYGDSISDAEKKREIEAMKANRERDSADLEALMGDRGEDADEDSNKSGKASKREDQA